MQIIAVIVTYVIVIVQFHMSIAPGRSAANATCVCNKGGSVSDP